MSKFSFQKISSLVPYSLLKYTVLLEPYTCFLFVSTIRLPNGTNCLFTLNIRVANVEGCVFFLTNCIWFCVQLYIQFSKSSELS